MAAGENGVHGESVASPVVGGRKSGLVNVMHQNLHARAHRAQETIKKAGCVISRQVMFVCLSVEICTC